MIRIINFKLNRLSIKVHRFLIKSLIINQCEIVTYFGILWIVRFMKFNIVDGFKNLSKLKHEYKVL